MSTKVAMLIMVGTSLIDNLSERRVEECGKLNDLENKPLRGARPNQVITALYNHFFQDLQCSLNSWSPSIAISFPSAEVQSFSFWLAMQPQGATVLSNIILMPTRTDRAQLCARKIKDILLDQVLTSGLAQRHLPANDQVEIPNPEPFELRLEDEKCFAQDIARFLKDLGAKVNKLKSEGIERIVFNITGGYKGLTPFFSLIGFLEEEVEVIYQHEEAKVVLRVPPLPLTWDFKLFDEYRCLLRAEDKHLMTPPPDKFRLLFEEKPDGWSKNPFGQLLEEIYTRDRLKRFGYGARLIRRLPEALQEELEKKRIPRWEHIWIGDQIPETVEHSRGHSQRVMEYAASLLEPRFAVTEKFLSDNELYCLICCLWLHDIGHTALSFRLPDEKVILVAPFPTLVRKFHHLVSYERICEYDYLPENERKAVALISKYDRAKMPLKKRDNKWENKDFCLIAEPLEEVIPDNGLDFRHEIIPKERVLLLCALLRMIDALDIQSDRVIDDNYWKERQQRTKEEVDSYRKLLSKRLKLLEWCPNNFEESIRCCKNKSDQVYIKWTKSLTDPSNSDKADEVRRTLEDEIEPKMVETIRKVLYLDECQALEQELLLGILSALDRVNFKMLQEAHFRKHSRVKLVYLTHREESSGGITKYQIQMIFDEDIRTTDDQKQKIANEIWGEVEKVRQILEGEGIILEGIFEGKRQLLPTQGGYDEPKFQSLSAGEGTFATSLD